MRTQAGTIWKLERSMGLELLMAWLTGYVLQGTSTKVDVGEGAHLTTWACLVWENCALLRLLSETDETMPRRSLLCSKGSTTGNNCHHDQPLSCLSPVLQPCGSEELSSTRSNWVEIRSMYACTEHWQVPWSVELGTGPNQGFTFLSYASGWPPVFPLALLHEELYVPVWAVWNPDQGVWLCESYS